VDQTKQKFDFLSHEYNFAQPSVSESSDALWSVLGGDSNDVAGGYASITYRSDTTEVELFLICNWVPICVNLRCLIRKQRWWSFNWLAPVQLCNVGLAESIYRSHQAADRLATIVAQNDIDSLINGYREAILQVAGDVLAGARPTGREMRRRVSGQLPGFTDRFETYV
jgi:hypothetical protein